MKVTNDKKYKSASKNDDLMQLVSELQEKHGTIFFETIDDTFFIYRPLGRNEYRDLLGAKITKLQEEDVLCESCVLYPENFDFENCPAGIPSVLADKILKNSYLDSLESKKLAIAYYREEMNLFDNQIDCIISEAFPYLDIEDIKTWDMAKTASYLAKAEWKLNILRNVPIDYETSDRMLEADWLAQHSQRDTNDVDADVQVQEKTEVVQAPVQQEKPAPKREFVSETLEERQARLAKEQGTPRKKTPQEIAELKRRFPEIDWGAEVDPNKDIDAMRDVVDTTAPALRVGR